MNFDNFSETVAAFSDLNDSKNSLYIPTFKDTPKTCNGYTDYQYFKHRFLLVMAALNVSSAQQSCILPMFLADFPLTVFERALKKNEIMGIDSAFLCLDSVFLELSASEAKWGYLKALENIRQGADESVSAFFSRVSDIFASLDKPALCVDGLFKDVLCSGLRDPLLKTYLHEYYFSPSGDLLEAYQILRRDENIAALCAQKTNTFLSSDDNQPKTKSKKRTHRSKKKLRLTPQSAHVPDKDVQKLEILQNLSEVEIGDELEFFDCVDSVESLTKDTAVDSSTPEQVLFVQRYSLSKLVISAFLLWIVSCVTGIHSVVRLVLTSCVVPRMGSEVSNKGQKQSKAPSYWHKIQGSKMWTSVVGSYLQTLVCNFAKRYGCM